MNIGEASRASGISAKMIRHYESLGLLPTVARSAAGYRQYDAATVHTLRFVRRARDLGFGLHEIETLLQLWADGSRASGDVKRIALAHVADLELRIARMQAMQRTLERLAHACHGDARPDCPILDDLAGERAAGEPPATPSRPSASTAAAPRRRPTARRGG
ncbi:MAG: Cu(I)-responsive transcriptional regulator [Burkholderiaceae bacterium]|jgi:Cu(I)-responsive transcriptional regulator|nr:Cu(I)-responsive transcriptional regulator [Burkholderiaceae bacterium]